jgi:uncharacterized RDD family membrane protein YckC
MTFDDRITISTPEGVDLELVLAGLGSRFAAALLDLLIQFGAIIALLFVLGAAGDSGVAIALFFIGVFLILFGYDIVLETWNSGRTVGKLAAGLRVVRGGGEPVGFLTSAIRNVVRIVDFLPAFYPVGMITILVTTRNQRLGDLAAGTLVIRDRRRAPTQAYAAVVVAPASPPVPAPAAPLDAPYDAPYMEWDVSAVTADDTAVLRHFLARRADLDPGPRAHLALDLAGRVRSKVAGPIDGWHPEAFLEGVVAAKSRRG